MDDLQKTLNSLIEAGGGPLAVESSKLAGFDYSDVAALGQLVAHPDVDGDGKLTVKDFILIAVQHPTALAAIFVAIKGLFHHKPKPGPVVRDTATAPSAPAAVAPTPEIPEPVIVHDNGAETVHPSRVTPQGLVAPLAGKLRTIASLDARLFFFENQGNVAEKDEAKKARKGDGNIPWGARIHYDISPRTADGAEIGPGSPELNGMLGEDGVPAMHYRWTWDDGAESSYPGESNANPAEIHSYDDDFGCTPVLKVPKDVEDSERHKLTLQAFLPACAATGGQEIVSNEVVVYIS